MDRSDTMDIRRIYAASTTKIHRNTVVIFAAISGLFSEKVKIPFKSVSMALLLYTVIKICKTIIRKKGVYFVNLKKYTPSIYQSDNIEHPVIIPSGTLSL